ncbi:hypothetical protein KCV07_g430, partial [Aureobasidium melanogenum]
MSSSSSVNNAAGQPSILTNMTSGIELEVLAYAPSGVDPRRHLANALSEPILLPCSKCNQSHSWKLPYLGLLDRKNFVEGFSYAGWKIMKDGSVRPDKDELVHVPSGSTFFNMEIVSRVMNFTKPTPCPLNQTYPCTGEPFEWEAQTEIFSVIQRANEAFSGPGYCLAINRNTGYHVHFGDGKNQPPVKTSLGIFGVFTALERQLDQTLTCSRIPILRHRGHPDSGVPRPNAVYKYDQKAKQSWYVGSGSRVFLENLREVVDASSGKHEPAFLEALAVVVDATISSERCKPEDNHRVITSVLKHANVPAWLDKLSRFNKVKDFLDDYPNRRNGQDLGSRYLAVNLDNLRSSGGKNTVEIRLSPGSMDPSEIYAWYDFVGKLMLWLSTPTIVHSSIILDIWADPNSTVLDLIREIAASQFTIDYYTDRLTPDWGSIENNRLKDAHRESVDAKISQKLEGGYYGQLPDAVFRTLPDEIQNHPDSHTLNMGACDYGKWADKAIAVAKPIDFYAPFSPTDSDSECDCKMCQLENCGCKKCLKTLRRLCCDCKNHSKKSLKFSFASHLSDSSEEFPFRKTDNSKRTFATPAPPEGFSDTRPDTPASSENDWCISSVLSMRQSSTTRVSLVKDLSTLPFWWAFKSGTSKK